MNIDKLSYSDLEEFDSDILDVENPQLQRYLVNGEELKDHHNNKYMKILKDYVVARKENYDANVPKPTYY